MLIGRSWNWKDKMRVFMGDNNNRNNSIIENIIDKLIRLFIKSGKKDRLYILAHLERWALTSAEWFFGCVKDAVFNARKSVLKGG